MRKVWRVRLRAGAVALLFGLAFGEPLGRFVRDAVAALLATSVSGSAPTAQPASVLLVGKGSAAPVAPAVVCSVTASCDLYTNHTAGGLVTFDLSGITTVGAVKSFFVGAEHMLAIRAPTGGKIYFRTDGYQEWGSAQPGASASIVYVGSGTWALLGRDGFAGTWKTR